LKSPESGFSHRPKVQKAHTQTNDRMHRDRSNILLIDLMD
jgi:hypothetical protein